jgi:hypothetical protein
MGIALQLLLKISVLIDPYSDRCTSSAGCRKTAFYEKVKNVKADVAAVLV